MNMGIYMTHRGTHKIPGSDAYSSGNSPGITRQSEVSSDNSKQIKLRDLLTSKSTQKSNVHQGFSQNSVIEDSLKNAKQLAQSRANKADTASQVKKLKYKSKDISGQIRQSKTSVSAKKVVVSARREVLRLKKLRANKDYDEDEVSAAIAHAQSMERVAKKKLRHLQEEEMVKISDSAMQGYEPEVDEDETDAAGESQAADAMYDENGENSYFSANQMHESLNFESTDFAGEQMVLQDFNEPEFVDDLAEMQDDLDAMIATDCTELSEEMQEIFEEMEELFENTDLGELLEDAMPIAPREMTKMEFKFFQQEHRNKEEKMIVKADMEFMKDMFENFAQQSIDVSV